MDRKPDAGRAGPVVMLGILFRMQLARLRQSWRPYLVVSAVMPAGIVLLLHLVDPHMSLSLRQQVVWGAMLLAASISGIVMLSQHVAHLKASGALDHYRVLPVSLAGLILVLAVVYGLFAWPGILLIGLEGAWLDHVAWSAGPAWVAVFLLEGLALGGIGALIGLLAPQEGLAGLFGNLVMMGVLFGGMVPLPPGPVRLAADLLPSGFGLALLRSLALGQPAGGGLWAGLTAYALVVWALASRVVARPE
ncbi:ABC transporter [Candidatus Hydrogenisulfobacillus filiaventi]|uniref:ABC transporter n=1 Tax=Candidatus Hydrogenisulfobacillus filiaventi TaxID=2707344 RepID=A0A6F8ZEW9_9FIRM|nr:ABC transporter [Bacillota bacterium]CAB1128183.1 ABC transporter [Candidatus Hydrogenisulfobacillus filiaventi]